MFAAFGPGSARLALWAEGTTFRVLNAETGGVIAEIDAHPVGSQAVLFHPDGRRLAIAEGQSQVRIWDLDRNEAAFVLDGPGGAVGFSPDGTRLVSNAKGRLATLWDTATGIRLCTFSGTGEGSFGFDRSGRWLVSSDQALYAPQAGPSR